jgi:hypothetical protein
MKPVKFYLTGFLLSADGGYELSSTTVIVG